MVASGRRCGTCKDRHILCDRGLPACQNCIQSSRQCQGYGIRLSWPRANDRRRAVLGIAPPAKRLAKANAASPLRIVNTSIWDIEIYYYLTTSGSNILPTVPASLSWSPITSETDYNLLQYFACKASNSLVAVCPFEDSPSLGDILIRVALSQGTRSSNAVLQSLLALSSLHRHGIQAYAGRLKLSALSVLVASAKLGVEGHEVISHVAALMLLCCFEIQQASETSSQWLYYISAVKNVLKAAHLGSTERSSDITALLYWVWYHDTLARFSLHYWKRRQLVEEPLVRDPGLLVQNYSILEASDTPFSCPETIRLVSEVFNQALEPLDARSSPENHKYLQTILKWRIAKLSIAEVAKKSPTCPAVLEDSRNQELFELALLVYLERMSGSSPGQSAKLRSTIDAGFTLFSQFETLQRQFPVLIIGCEARSDKERMVVLDLISRTQENIGARSLQGMKGILQSLWAQDDLSESELNYTDKVQAVLSSRRILPSFI